MNGNQFPWMNPSEFRAYIDQLVEKEDLKTLKELLNAFVDYTEANDASRAQLSADLLNILGPKP